MIDEKKSNRLLLLAVFSAFVIISILYVSLKHRDSRIERSKLKKSIDSVYVKQSERNDSVINKSKKSVEYSKKIIKKISNEKIIIPDTTYVFMCDYITNYGKK